MKKPAKPKTRKHVPVKRLSPDATIPVRSSKHAAGWDLFSAEEKTIHARAFDAVGTGIAVSLPRGGVGLIWPRSGLSLKHGIGTLAGVVDSDYRGEIRVVLMNNGDRDYAVKKGDRIAQLLIQMIDPTPMVEVAELPESGRGDKGFGSTGR